MMALMSSELADLRAKIDASDRDIIAALGERMRLVDAVGAYKKANAMGTVDSARLQDVLSTRAAWGREAGLSEDFVHELYEKIHDESVRRENLV